MDIDIDEDDGLSTALGTESLAARDMVPAGFDNTPRARGQQLPILLCANGPSTRYLALLPHANASEYFHLQRSLLLRREISWEMTQLRPWSA